MADLYLSSLPVLLLLPLKGLRDCGHYHRVGRVGRRAVIDQQWLRGTSTMQGSEGND